MLTQLIKIFTERDQRMATCMKCTYPNFINRQKKALNLALSLSSGDAQDGLHFHFNFTYLLALVPRAVVDHTSKRQRRVGNLPNSKCFLPWEV